MSNNNNIIKRGEIYYADLGQGAGSEQKGLRPVLVIQNDVGNKFSPTIIVAAITSKTEKRRMPTHVAINAKKYGLPEDSVVLLEQIRTIDKSRLGMKIGALSNSVMDEIDRSSKISIGLSDARFNDRYIYEKIQEINELNSIIEKYKSNNSDLMMEELEKISLVGDIINYCKEFSVNVRTYLNKITITDKIAI